VIIDEVQKLFELTKFNGLTDKMNKKELM